MGILSRLVSLAAGVVLVAGLASPRSAAAETASTSVIVHAAFSARSVLNVSTTTLDFTTRDSQGAGTASVDVQVSVRTRADGDVLLFAEPLWAETSGLEALRVRVDGAGEGLSGGVLEPSQRLLIGRWTGSGRHGGTLVFRLPASGPMPSGPLAVHFVLTAP